MKISPFWFCLNSSAPRAIIKLSKNVDVNETAVELEISFKMLCLATPCAKCYKGVCDNQTRDEHDLDNNEDNNE